MKVGCMTCNFFNEICGYQETDLSWGDRLEKYHREYTLDNLADLLKHIRSLGYERIELWEAQANYLVLGPDRAGEVKEIAQSAGISIEAYCVGGLSQDNIAHAGTALEFARGLGTDLVTGCLDPDLASRVDSLCQEYGVRYAIENHRGAALESPQQVREVLDKCSQSIGACIDTGHFAIAGYDTVEAARMLADRLYHVHLKDTDGQKCVQFGTGLANISGFLAVVAESECTGMLSVEHETAYDPSDDIEHNLEYAEKVLKSLR